MRVLVLDRSGILPWLVAHVPLPAVEVVAVRTVEEAERAITDQRLDVAIVNLPPHPICWQRFQHLCASHQPPVPVLYESATADCPDGAGIEPGDGVARFLRQPVSRDALHAALAEVLGLGGASRGRAPLS